jgi:hypothetical protein
MKSNNLLKSNLLGKQITQGVKWAVQVKIDCCTFFKNWAVFLLVSCKNIDLFWIDLQILFPIYVGYLFTFFFIVFVSGKVVCFYF